MTRTALTVLAAGCVGLTVLLQAQSPVFEAAQLIPIGAGSQQLTLIDTNGDNHLDLVVSRYQHGITVLLGNGRGQFLPAPFDSQTLAQGGPGKSIDLKIEPGAIAIGDVVGDSQPDLVVAFRDKANEYLQVFHGDGHGRFGPGGTKRYETSTSFEFYKPAIQLADVDGNGWLDIITSNGRRNTIEILLANARGGSSAAFTPAPAISLTPHSTFWTFGVGDFDADGRADLLTTFDPEGGHRVALRFGKASGMVALRNRPAASRSGRAHGSPRLRI